LTTQALFSPHTVQLLNKSDV